VTPKIYETYRLLLDWLKIKSMSSRASKRTNWYERRGCAEVLLSIYLDCSSRKICKKLRIKTCGSWNCCGQHKTSRPFVPANLIEWELAAAWNVQMSGFMCCAFYLALLSFVRCFQGKLGGEFIKSFSADENEKLGRIYKCEKLGRIYKGLLCANLA